MAFRGKNAVVTGGAGGIGLQVARQLLVAGVAVSLVSLANLGNCSNFCVLPRN